MIKTAYPLDMHILPRTFTFTNDRLGQSISIPGNYTPFKYVRTVKGESMAPGTFIDHEGNFFDTTHFPP